MFSWFVLFSKKYLWGFFYFRIVFLYVEKKFNYMVYILEYINKKIMNKNKFVMNFIFCDLLNFVIC